MVRTSARPSIAAALSELDECSSSDNPSLFPKSSSAGNIDTLECNSEFSPSSRKSDRYGNYGRSGGNGNLEAAITEAWTDNSHEISAPYQCHANQSSMQDLMHEDGLCTKTAMAKTESDMEMRLGTEETSRNTELGQEVDTLSDAVKGSPSSSLSIDDRDPSPTPVQVKKKKKLTSNAKIFATMLLA